MERGESAQRSMEAQQRVLCEAEGRAGSSQSSFLVVLVMISCFAAVFVTVKVEDST